MLAQSSLTGVALVAKATTVRAKRNVQVRAANKYADELLETAVRAMCAARTTRDGCDRGARAAGGGAGDATRAGRGRSRGYM